MENRIKYVLLVEDNPIDFDEFERLLSALGYTAIRKPNNLPVARYEDAIAALKSNQQIEFALLDINLPGIKTGVDIAEYILKNKFPIKIIFTTAYLTDSVAEDISYVGTQFGTIAKPGGIIDSKISLFHLRQLIAPSNPLQATVIDNLFVNCITINPKKPLWLQLKDDTQRVKRKRIEKRTIYYILTGDSDIITVPKNKCLIITDSPKEGFVVNTSLDKFIERILDESFVRINEHTCINIQHYEESETGSKFQIVVQGQPFQVSKKYISDFKQRLERYKLVP